MNLKLIRDDTRGFALVEYTITLPLFLLLMFGLVQAGILLWTWVGLQHGVEMAARCASVNYNASQAGLNASCFTVNGAPVPSAVTHTDVEAYAQQNSFGINLPSSNFHATLNTTCGTNAGNQVTASYTFNLIHYVFSAFSVPLSAKSCYPIS
jgi:Flp pilus assembly protein TadG